MFAGTSQTATIERIAARKDTKAASIWFYSNDHSIDFCWSIEEAERVLRDLPEAVAKAKALQAEVA